VVATVRLFSKQGFCSPSLDELQLSENRTPVYRNVSPGPHRVYCSEQTGAKELVRVLEVPPGADMNVLIPKKPWPKP